MQITKNFSWEEFASGDGAPFSAEAKKNIPELAKNLEVLRAEIQRPIRINSGYRSPAYNQKVGGVHDSQHVLGKAADIVVNGLTPKELAQKIETLIRSGRMKQGGLGIYDTFVHYDIRGVRARWDFSSSVMQKTKKKAFLLVFVLLLGTLGWVFRK